MEESQLLSSVYFDSQGLEMGGSHGQTEHEGQKNTRKESYGGAGLLKGLEIRSVSLFKPPPPSRSFGSGPRPEKERQMQWRLNLLQRARDPVNVTPTAHMSHVFSEFQARLPNQKQLRIVFPGS